MRIRKAAQRKELILRVAELYGLIFGEIKIAA
jgi:hypothetical protein